VKVVEWLVQGSATFFQPKIHAALSSSI